MARHRQLVYCCYCVVIVFLCGSVWLSPTTKDLLNKSLLRAAGYAHSRNATTSFLVPKPSTPAINDKVSTLEMEKDAGETKSSVRAHDKQSSLSLLPGKEQMPFSDSFKQIEEIGRSGEWLIELHTYLSTLNKSVSPQVNMVFGDYNHRLLVLNWITAALDVIRPPLGNILVLSLDHLLCELLDNKTLPVACVAVPKNSLVNESKSPWLKGALVRVVVLRIISYWGYDVASYDSDAVLLGNPQALFDERPDVHIFSAAGTFPGDVSEKWGFALCTGSLMIRATPAVGSLWRHVCSLSGVHGEQWPLNVALVEMNTVWRETTPISDRCTVQEGWEGQGDDGILVYVFPPRMFCRAACCSPGMPRQELYSVHPIASKLNMEEKARSLKKMKVWFLQPDTDHV